MGGIDLNVSTALQSTAVRLMMTCSPHPQLCPDQDKTKPKPKPKTKAALQGQPDACRARMSDALQITLILGPMANIERLDKRKQLHRGIQ